MSKLPNKRQKITVQPIPAVCPVQSKYELFNNPLDHLQSSSFSALEEFTDAYLTNQTSVEINQDVPNNCFIDGCISVVAGTCFYATIKTSPCRTYTNIDVYSHDGIHQCSVQSNYTKPIVAFAEDSLCFAVSTRNFIRVYSCVVGEPLRLCGSVLQDSNTLKKLKFSKETPNHPACLFVISRECVTICFFRGESLLQSVLEVPGCVDIVTYHSTLVCLCWDDAIEFFIYSFWKFCPAVSTNHVNEYDFVVRCILSTASKKSSPVAFSEDGTKLAVVGLAGLPKHYVYIWNVSNLLDGQLSNPDEILISAGSVHELSITTRSDGSLLVLATVENKSNTRLYCIDAQTGAKFKKFDPVGDKCKEDVSLISSLAFCYNPVANDVFVIWSAIPPRKPSVFSKCRVFVNHVMCPSHSTVFEFPGIGLTLPFSEYYSVLQRRTKSSLTNPQLDVGPFCVGGSKIKCMIGYQSVTYTPPPPFFKVLQAFSIPPPISHVAPAVVVSPVKAPLKFELTTEESQTLLFSFCVEVLQLELIPVVDIQKLIISFLPLCITDFFQKSKVVFTIWDRSLMYWGIRMGVAYKPDQSDLDACLGVENCLVDLMANKSKQTHFIETLPALNNCVSKLLNQNYLCKFPPSSRTGGRLSKSTKNNTPQVIYPLNGSEFSYTRTLFPIESQNHYWFRRPFPKLNIRLSAGVNPLVPVLRWFKDEEKTNLARYKVRDPQFKGLILIVFDPHKYNFDQEVSQSGFPVIPACDIPLHTRQSLANHTSADAFKICLLPVRLYSAVNLSENSGFKNCVLLLFADYDLDTPNPMLPFVHFVNGNFVMDTASRQVILTTNSDLLGFTVPSSVVTNPKKKNNPFDGLHEGNVSLMHVLGRLLDIENKFVKKWAKNRNLPVIDVAKPGIITGNSQFCVSITFSMHWPEVVTNIVKHVESNNPFVPRFIIIPEQHFTNHILQHCRHLKKYKQSPDWFTSFLTTSPVYMNMMTPTQLQRLRSNKSTFDAKSVRNLHYEISDAPATSSITDNSSTPAKLVQPDSIPYPASYTIGKKPASIENLPTFFYLMCNEKESASEISIFDSLLGNYTTWTEFLETCGGTLGSFRIWIIHNQCIQLCSELLNDNIYDLIGRFFQVYIDIHKNRYRQRNDGLFKLRTLCSSLQVALNAKFDLYN